MFAVPQAVCANDASPSYQAAGPVAEHRVIVGLARVLGLVLSVRNRQGCLSGTCFAYFSRDLTHHLVQRGAKALDKWPMSMFASRSNHAGFGAYWATPAAPQQETAGRRAVRRRITRYREGRGPHLHRGGSLCDSPRYGVGGLANPRVLKGTVCLLGNAVPSL
ncbi:hypothetical protein VTK26DRAFT_8117 [Humicola hyalothermophila]